MCFARVLTAPSPSTTTVVCWCQAPFAPSIHRKSCDPASPFMANQGTCLCYGSGYPYLIVGRPFYRTGWATRSLTACNGCGGERSAVSLGVRDSCRRGLVGGFTYLRRSPPTPACPSFISSIIFKVFFGQIARRGRFPGCFLRNRGYSKFSLRFFNHGPGGGPQTGDPL